MGIFVWSIAAYGVHLVSAETPELLSAEESRTFWVSWERGVISCGRGFVLHANTLLQWNADPRHRVAFVGFATSWRKKADFRWSAVTIYTSSSVNSRLLLQSTYFLSNRQVNHHLFKHESFWNPVLIKS